MEESKELQGFYKIFRAVIYISVLMEFFEYAIDPRAIDGFGGVVCDLHDRIKQWFIYHDGNLVYSKVVTMYSFRMQTSILQMARLLFHGTSQPFLLRHGKMALAPHYLSMHRVPVTGMQL